MKFIDDKGIERTWMSPCPECGRFSLAERAVSGTGIGAVYDGNGGALLHRFAEPSRFRYLECTRCEEAVAFPQTSGV